MNVRLRSRAMPSAMHAYPVSPIPQLYRLDAGDELVVMNHDCVDGLAIGGRERNLGEIYSVLLDDGLHAGDVFDAAVLGVDVLGEDPEGVEDSLLSFRRCVWLSCSVGLRNWRKL